MRDDGGVPADKDFVEFFQTSRHRVCRMLMITSTDTRDVEDVTQEAFIAARREWQTIRDYDKPEAWVLKVALRRLRKWQARDQHRTILSGDVLGDMGDTRDDPSGPADGTEELYDAIRKLPRRRGEAIGLQLLGYSAEEIADIQSLQPGTVRSHLCLARRDLRRLLEHGALPAAGESGEEA